MSKELSELINSLLAFISVIGFIVAIAWFARDTDLELLNAGVITEQQYCQKKQDSKQPPARCYKYFGVKPVGERYNPTTKTYETILIPNE